MTSPLLKVNELSITFKGNAIVQNISFSLNKQEVISLVGESGSGKSVTALSILGLLPPGGKTSGSIEFDSTEILGLPSKKLRSIRGQEIGMIFQEPMSALNPVFTVGHQIEETLLSHQRISRLKARSITLDVMKEVGLPPSRFGNYPHEFSGGMLQRVLIAIALICEPRILIADEPTTALDTATSMQVMQLITSLKEKRKMSVLLISHDLDLVSKFSDVTCVLRRGKIVESGASLGILQKPKHPYTQALVACKPSFHKGLERLPTLQKAMEK